MVRAGVRFRLAAGTLLGWVVYLQRRTLRPRRLMTGLGVRMKSVLRSSNGSFAPKPAIPYLRVLAPELAFPDGGEAAGARAKQGLHVG